MNRDHEGTLRIGVIGLGMGASIALANSDPDTPVRASVFCSSSLPQAQAMAAKWGVPAAVDTAQKLVNRDDVDAVAVFSPDHLHYEHCMMALSAGKHVLCTKPMVTTLEHAKNLKRKVAETGLVFVLGQTMRFEPQFALARSLLENGTLGSISIGEAHYVHDARHFMPLAGWRLSAPQDLLYGGLSHPLDAMLWLLGDAESVSAVAVKGKTFPSYPLIDNFLVNIRFSSGAIGRAMGLFGVAESPLSMMGVSLFGDRGAVKAQYTDLRGGSVQWTSYCLETGQPATVRYPPEVEGAYGHGQTVIRMLRSFSSAINDRFSCAPSVEDGLRSTALCAAVDQSIQRGSPVHLAELVT